MKKRKTLHKNELLKQRRQNRTKRRTKKKKSIRYKSKKIKQNKQRGGAIKLLNSGGIPDKMVLKITDTRDPHLLTTEDLKEFNDKIGLTFTNRVTKVYLVFALLGIFFHPILVLTDSVGNMNESNLAYQFLSEETRYDRERNMRDIISDYSLRGEILALVYIGEFNSEEYISLFKTKLNDNNSFLLGNKYNIFTNNCQTYVYRAFQYLKSLGDNFSSPMMNDTYTMLDIDLFTLPGGRGLTKCWGGICGIGNPIIEESIETA